MNVYERRRRMMTETNQFRLQVMCISHSVSTTTILERI